MISIAKPTIGEKEKRAVCNVLDSGMIACGGITTEFEKKFSSYIGVKYGIATTSGTTALEVGIRALGIGKGDKVLTTAFSFIASTNAIIYSGAIPVFSDIEENNFNIDPNEIERKLQKDKTIKAVLIVHLFGRPCNMEAIQRITEKYGVFLIEDCAQAHGAVYQGKKVGSFGDAAAFSFYPTKNMTTGEGGMVVSNHKKVEEKARLLINHGMKTRYYHDVIGYNYRMTNLAAAIGLCQLESLDDNNKKRREHALKYTDEIKNRFIICPEDAEGHVYHQYTIRIKNDGRRRLIKHLEDNEIGYGIFYPLSIPEQKCYKDYNFSTTYKNTDFVKEEVLSIPVHPLLQLNEAEKVIQVINNFEG